MAAILKSVDGRRLEMSDNVDSVILKSGLVENVEVEVEIASLSEAVQKLLPLPFFRPPSWYSGGRRRQIFRGMAPLKSPYPKMGGVDTGFVSLAGRWAKLDGGAKLHPPPLFALQNRSRYSRVNSALHFVENASLVFSKQFGYK